MKRDILLWGLLFFLVSLVAFSGSPPTVDETGDKIELSEVHFDYEFVSNDIDLNQNTSGSILTQDQEYVTVEMSYINNKTYAGFANKQATSTHYDQVIEVNSEFKDLAGKPYSFESSGGNFNRIFYTYGIDNDIELFPERTQRSLMKDSNRYLCRTDNLIV
jgi:hypothetical protein